MKNVLILGATGSIGTSTLDVIARHPERYRVAGVTAEHRIDALIEICRQHRPEFAVVGAAADASAIARALRESSPRTELLRGPEGLVTAARAPGVDAVMAAIVGAAGLRPTLAAAQSGKQVLLANKEALVMTGALFMDAVRLAGASLLPIDSEHNAIFQCLPAGAMQRLPEHGVKRILLTGSGGPFRQRPLAELANVTPEEACRHPTWNMGPKISVDSATMMNKALEVIEARWLFGAPPEAIDIVVHPQSVIHSMVEYADGSVLAQLGNPDMRTPIAQALAWPDRIDAGVASLDLTRVAQLTFERPDFERFPALALSYQVLRSPDSAAVTFNAANEIAVGAFLERRLAFTAIMDIVKAALDADPGHGIPDIETVIDVDARARQWATAAVGQRS